MTAPDTRGADGEGWSRGLLAIGLAASAAASVGFACAGRGGGEAGPAYVGSLRCGACHAQELAAWRGSHHDLAMQEATSETVLGDFEDARFEHLGVETRFFRRDGRYFVETEGADGEAGEFEVLYAFGVEPLQQYLVDFPGGRLQCLKVAWDSERGRWFSLDLDERPVAGSSLHWTGRYLSWNAMCAECHSTNLRRGYDAATDTYETTWSEIDVGCEACHGPGEGHVAWAEETGGDGGSGGGSRGLVTSLRRGAQTEQLDACAPCHSRRSPLARDLGHGGSFLDDYLPERLHAGMYHADGQILDEVYVYGSFVQSKMFLRGVSCSDCHDPHSLEPLASGNALCTQCHSPNAPLERFPTLTPKLYDDPAHHFHEPDSPGSRCVACHMPERTYMVVDPRRDHGFRIPRPDLALEHGTPQACEACHDEGAEWAADELRERFGPPDDRLGDGFAVPFARARAGDGAALDGLVGVALDQEQAPLVRATALEILPAFGSAVMAVLAGALQDEDPIVRASAVSGLGELPAQAVAGLAAPLLEDPVRSVRIQTARALVGEAERALGEADRGRFEVALGEFIEAQRAAADLPGAHLNLGAMYADRGDVGAAEAAYRDALRLDPGFLPARFNLATLMNERGRNREAERVLRGGLEWAPDEGELHYSLGLLLGEMERLDDAAESLLEASRLLPGRGRVQYNAGLALQRSGRLAEAETALRRAQRDAPDDPDTAHALAGLYLELGDRGQAREFVERLEELAPGHPALGELRSSLAGPGTRPESP